MKHTPLFETHTSLGAKLGPFGGYMLPIWYHSLKSEHLAVRQHAGMFDICHMGLLFLTGENVLSALQTLSCNSLEKSKSQTMVYSMMLNESGGILDDVMIGCIAGGVLVVVNASNKSKILDWMQKKLPAHIHIQDLNTDHGFVAIQGPQAVQIMEKALSIPLSTLPRFSVSELSLLGHPVWALRTGYTGEDGFELILPHSILVDVWNTCIHSGITPCGLAARDSLRIEAGLPLYGHELSESITPAMTRYRWVVKFTHEFIGRSALEPGWNTPPALTTVGLQLAGKLIAREGYPITEGGHILSGTLSPLTEKSIAMALVSPQFSSIGTTVHIQIRGSEHPATVVPIPFK
jgi:aminomethyltransferase